MKLTREETEPVFRPITLTLETKEEVIAFINMLNPKASLAAHGLGMNLLSMLNNPNVNNVTDAARDRRYS